MEKEQSGLRQKGSVVDLIAVIRQMERSRAATRAPLEMLFDKVDLVAGTQSETIRVLYQVDQKEREDIGSTMPRLSSDKNEIGFKFALFAGK